MVELYFVYGRCHEILLGCFADVRCAIRELKNHQDSQRPNTRQRFYKILSSDHIRIDYGAKDCYYLITLHQNKETKNQ